MFIINQNIAFIPLVGISSTGWKQQVSGSVYLQYLFVLLLWTDFDIPTWEDTHIQLYFHLCSYRLLYHYYYLHSIPGKGERTYFKILQYEYCKHTAPLIHCALIRNVILKIFLCLEAIYSFLIQVRRSQASNSRQQSSTDHVITKFQKENYELKRRLNAVRFIKHFPTYTKT